MKRIILAAFAALGVAAATPANSATLIIDGNGILTGANGVNVNGTLYDVSFLDGTCAAVFEGCDSQSDITFTTPASATAAANALLQQVFIGIFNTNTALIRGCSDTTRCYAFIPQSVNAGAAYGAAALNFPNFSDGTSFFSTQSAFNSTSTPFYTWAKFTLAPVAAVPEPATWLMMLLGFGAIGYTMRSKKKSEPRIQFA